MLITENQALEIIAVHDSLWNAVYSESTSNRTLIYKDKSYSINIPPHKGYASVLLPNPEGKNFLWITQNLHKSTYGTLAIAHEKELGNDHRITWIVDSNNGTFKYRTNILTNRDSNGELIFGVIEIYDSLGKAVVWSNNNSILTRKAEF